MPLIFTTRAGKQNQHGRLEAIGALYVDMDLLETKERVKIYGRLRDGELKILCHEVIKRNTALIKSIFNELATRWAEERRNGKRKGSFNPVTAIYTKANSICLWFRK